jgi:hypothetical protein
MGPWNFGFYSCNTHCPDSKFFCLQLSSHGFHGSSSTIVWVNCPNNSFLIYLFLYLSIYL